MSGVQELGQEPGSGRPVTGGRPLSELLNEDGPLDPAGAADIGLRLLGVVEAAHGKGIAHGDINPARVLLSPDGEVVLTGFGRVGTDPSLPAGDPSYASPEQARGDAATPATDLWALGAVLFAMVEGRPPYRDRGWVEATLSAVEQEPVPSSPNAGPLAQSIQGLLRKDPQERLTEPVVRQALERILNQDRPADARTGPRLPWLRGDGESWWPPACRRDGRRVRTVAVAVAALVVTTSVVALAASGRLTQGDDRASGPAPSAPPPSGATPSGPRETPSPSAPPSPSPSAVPDDPPAGFYRFSSSAGPAGFSIFLPKGWKQVPSGSRYHVKFGADGDARNLVVTFGKGPESDPVDGWQRLVPSLEKLSPGFQRVDEIRRVDYRGWKAADIEWSSAVGSDPFRTFGRGFLVGGGRGYTIRWTTPADESDSAENKRALDTFLTSFEETKPKTAG